MSKIKVFLVWAALHLLIPVCAFANIDPPVRLYTLPASSTVRLDDYPQEYISRESHEKDIAHLSERIDELRLYVNRDISDIKESMRDMEAKFNYGILVLALLSLASGGNLVLGLVRLMGR